MSAAARPVRPPHPDDMRDVLRDFAARRRRHEREGSELIAELAGMVATAKLAGLHMQEIAELVGVTRAALYRAVDAVAEE